MFRYKDIAFRVIEENDLEPLRALHNDQETFLNLSTIDFIDENNQKNWWQTLHKKSNDKRYVICLSKKPELIIGRLRIQNIDHQNKNCEVGLDISADYRGKGYGFKSYQMLLGFLFDHYNMNMVYLRVADFNPNAKGLYEKVGFEQTGFLKDYFYRHGKYWNYYIMCITREKFNTENP